MPACLRSGLLVFSYMFPMLSIIEWKGVYVLRQFALGVVQHNSCPSHISNTRLPIETRTYTPLQSLSGKISTIQSLPFRVLVLCAGNRARSQMAQGWLRHLGGEQVAVQSAGTAPKGLHPLAVSVMADVGIDISAHTSDHVDQYVAQDFDLVLTVCDSARETCPVFPGAKRMLHRSFEDPDKPELDEDELLAVFRRIRDETGEYSRQLLDTLYSDSQLDV